jgi:hypothetical protein
VYTFPHCSCFFLTLNHALRPSALIHTQVDKLVRVRRLLDRLGFLNELPERLEGMIHHRHYKEAVQLYNKTISVLTRHSHVLSFQKIKVGEGSCRCSALSFAGRLHVFVVLVLRVVLYRVASCLPITMRGLKRVPDACPPCKCGAEQHSCLVSYAVARCHLVGLVCPPEMCLGPATIHHRAGTYALYLVPE